MLACLLHGIGGSGDARFTSAADPSPRRGTSCGTSDVLSHDTDRWPRHLLPRGWSERCADAFTPARTSLFITDVRATLCTAFRSLSFDCAGLPRLRAQRL